MAAASSTSSTSQLPLAGRVAVVTGSSHGIGRSIAIDLHSQGARVAFNYVSNSTQADLLIGKELKGTGVTANCVASGPVATELFFQGKSEEAVKRIVDANPMGRLGEVEDISN
ncbi:NADPH-dependent aldehyde reductase-like protein, chloroplastic [Linum grandiflorum]